MRKRFTASVYIRFHEKYILLAHHKRFGLWVPIGGELEVDESPIECAIREMHEETGGTVEKKSAYRYMGYEEHDAAGRGLHMNFSFLLDLRTERKVEDPSKYLPEFKRSDEHNELKWFKIPEWPDPIPPNVYRYLKQINEGMYG